MLLQFKNFQACAHVHPDANKRGMESPHRTWPSKFVVRPRKRPSLPLRGLEDVIRSRKSIVQTYVCERDEETGEGGQKSGEAGVVDFRSKKSLEISLDF
jgi:hypothetical protein